MAKIDRLMVGESLVGDGNEVAHIDLIMGPRGSAAETAFANALVNNKDGFTALILAIAMGQEDIALEILERKGVDLNVQDLAF